MTDTMPEGLASAAACMLSPRIFTSFRPSSNLQGMELDMLTPYNIFLYLWRSQLDAGTINGALLGFCREKQVPAKLRRT